MNGVDSVDLALLLTAAYTGSRDLPSRFLETRNGRKVAAAFRRASLRYLSGPLPGHGPDLSDVMRCLDVIRKIGVKNYPKLLSLLPAPERVTTTDDAAALSRIRFPESKIIGTVTHANILEIFVRPHRVKNWRRRLRTLRRELQRNAPAASVVRVGQCVAQPPSVRYTRSNAYRVTWDVLR